MIQDAHISFRTNALIAAELARKARGSGCSVSEYLRSVVREKVLAE